jgi:hypothetical protein
VKGHKVLRNNLLALFHQQKIKCLIVFLPSGLEICGPVVVLVGTPSVEVFAFVPEMS